MKDVLIDALNRFLAGKHYCMCLCIEDALLAKNIKIRFLSQITNHIPEFNIDVATELFGAKEGVFWWNDNDKQSRIDYFNYLIKLYTDEKSSVKHRADAAVKRLGC